MNAIRPLIAVAAIALTGCASTHGHNPADPLEPLNRGIYQFNDTVDKVVAKPLAKGYSAAMPEPGKVMVSNFFSNLDDIIVTANDLLQFKFKQGLSDGMRVLVNTTIGVGGLIDVASMRLEKHNEDFGQTLGYWGIGNGPYIVLPLLGPSTVRDGVGLYVDSRPSKIRRVKHMRTRNQLVALKAINGRAKLLDQEKVLDEAVIDRYEFIRDAYLLRRQSLVYDGNPPREKYDDEEEIDTPAPPSTEKGSPEPEKDSPTKDSPAKPEHSSVVDSPSADKLAEAAPAIGEPSPAGILQPNVHKVWVAQQR